MNYKVLYDNPSEELLTRLLKIRNITEDIDAFLEARLQDYWIDPFLLNDMEAAVERIIFAVKQKQKIMIFGDYDVDGVTSSYILYKFITKYLDYKNVSIQYPDRIKEWYGIKKQHLDMMKSKGIDLIVTVDNGIASLEEALYAKKIGIDLIITDHHQDLESIPEAIAVVNPQVSPKYPFKWLAWVGVAFKLICALLTRSTFNQDKKNQIFNYFLPVVAIGTVADVVPLVNENRIIVKRGLEILNNQSSKIPSSLRGFLTYLNIKQPIDTYHIGYVIGPRINAGGRMTSPYDSLYSLLYSGEKQIPYLENLEQINTDRRALQEQMFKLAEQTINLENKFLVAYSDEFHEGIVGIVSWRLTEKYNKPSMIMKIDHEKHSAVASLRGPDYFDVITMIKSAGHLLLRFGGHRWAGGLSVNLDHLDELVAHFNDYCEKHIAEKDLKKEITIDTKLYQHERDITSLSKIDKLAPFGEWNEEPTFLLENTRVNKVEKVGSNGKWHLKIHSTHGEEKITSLFWGKGEDAANITSNNISLVWKVKKDTYNGWVFLEWIDMELS